MSDANHLRFLRIALIAIGLAFIFGEYTLSMVWPSGWAWGQGYSHYLMMIIGLYATVLSENSIRPGFAREDFDGPVGASTVQYE